ncbi:hypothetical protein [Dyadobacter sp. NIV53]|uniref:hypothetical protein n=1 Tax=Dyadobacter sp. NIV53 TaxID=2861765 RepID=UPI001C88DDD4|nr:hypothetical protein [Dyadobacter sp. NIV53]
MELLNLEMINAGPILADLRSRIQNFDVSETVFLSRTNSGNAEEQSLSVPDINAFNVSEFILPEILHMMGIRSLALNKLHDLTALANFDLDIKNVASEHYPWHYLRNEGIITELRLLFQNCRTIAFDNWSNHTGASDLWSGLLADVIRPLKKKDFEFIFYLGDPQKKLSFQVDEAIDIISDFSLYGQVTFALDENEAIKLWQILNGIDLDTTDVNQNTHELNRKYISIFRTMNVTRLLIYSASKAILFTKQRQFVLARKKVAPTIEMATNARQNFVAGFSIGLLLQLDIVHSLTLALIVFESLSEQKERMDQKNLLAHIDRWIEDLQKPETMYLYQ